MKLTPTEYSESFAMMIAVAAGSDALFIQKEIEAGVAQAWIFSCDEQTLGHAVTRLEEDTLVVVVYEGLNVEAFANLIHRVAILKELPWVRFHTVRPGLIKMLAAFKPEVLEYIVRVKAHGWT